METLRNCIVSRVDANNHQLDTILDAFENKNVKKGEYLVRKGTICREMAFIASGYLRMFNIADGKDVTLWIGGAGKFITSLSSFVFDTNSIWNIQALTDCELSIISQSNHFALCQKEPKWLEFDNLLLAHSFALLEQSMFAHLHTTAMQRVEALMAEEPALFNHVPLQHIASMLGITPESLSRLRKTMAESTS